MESFRSNIVEYICFLLLSCTICELITSPVPPFESENRTDSIQVDLLVISVGETDLNQTSDHSSLVVKRENKKTLMKCGPQGLGRFGADFCKWVPDRHPNGKYK